MSAIQGHCLCGEVQFELNGPLPKMYQCHCSECRRATGTSHNSSLLIREENLRWLQGEQQISHYQAESGYNINFCSQCASHVPNLLKQGKFYWVPAGTLDNSDELEIAAHLCVASMAKWDVISPQGEQFSELPELAHLFKLLKV